MLSGLPAWFAAVLTLLTLSAVAGAVAATFKANYAKSQIEFLQRDVKIRDDRIGILEEEKTRIANELTLVQQRETSLTEKVRVLETVVTGREQLEHMQNQFDRVTAQVERDHKEIQTTQRHIQDKLNEIIRLLKEDAA